MSSMGGISGMNGMPRNCGMEGMHGTAAGKQTKKAEGGEVQPQSKKLSQIPNDILGSKIDVKI